MVTNCCERRNHITCALSQGFLRMKYAILIIITGHLITLGIFWIGVPVFMEEENEFYGEAVWSDVANLTQASN